MDSVRSTLAVRLPNWVGDVVMALPTIAQLERSGFTLWALGQAWVKDLLAGLHLPITSVPSGIWAASRAQRTLRMDQGLLFTNSISTAAAMRLAGIRAVGYHARGRGPLLHAALVKKPGLHEVDHFWRLGEAAVQCWGESDVAWPKSPPERIELPLTSAQLAAADRMLTAARVSGPFVVLCPMAVGTSRGRSKQWPHFAEFARYLAADGFTIVACPGRGEEAACRMLLPRQSVVLPGVSLGVYAAVLSYASVVVANDSGPMHMAAAVGTPVLGIFGYGDPARTRPWDGHFIGGDEGWPEVDAVLNAFEEMTPGRRQAAIAGRIGPVPAVAPYAA